MWEWVQTAGMLLLLVASMIPIVLALALARHKLRGLPTFALSVGLVTSVVLLVSVGLRWEEQWKMDGATHALYWLQWVVYALLLASCIAALTVKHRSGMVGDADLFFV